MLTGYFLDILRLKKIICCSFFTRVRLNNLLQCSKTGCFRTEYRFSRLLVHAYFEIGIAFAQSKYINCLKLDFSEKPCTGNLKTY